ncbi:ATP-grasp domain-containing protein [Actinomadura hibisca]|uniref:ATP-grasp domain-containing protein n=1 Tax=Actinomadura hibisca TaxID=68565 RepID=UPI00083501FA|nr:ATP-grasp domain-containing protein [Actinomadura hibisca]
MYRVAVIGGQPHAVAAAKELGVEVVLVHEEGKYEEEFADYCERIVHAPITDSRALLEALAPLHRERPFDRVLTTSEDGAVATSELCEMLGLPGTSPETSRIVKDKAAMRKRLAEHDLSPVRHRLVHSADDLADFLYTVNGRIVVKPVDGVASIQIHVADTVEDAMTAWKRLREAGHDAALAEEFLEGPVVSVDTFSYRGRHLAIGMSEYRMNEYFAEWEVSTPSRVSVPYRDELRRMTYALLDALGLKDGPAHSEFILTPEGPRVLETHNRLAGSGAPELVRRVSSLSLSRMFLSVTLGIEELPAEPPEWTSGAAIRFFVPPPGKITAIEGVDSLAELGATVVEVPPGVTLPNIVPYINRLTGAELGVVIGKGVGDEVRELRSVADCVNGYVIASGKDADDAVARGDEVVRRIRMETR